MRNLTTWLIVAALAILLMMGSVFVINESQTSIVLNLGKIVRSNLQPGLHDVAVSGHQGAIGCQPERAVAGIGGVAGG